MNLSSIPDACMQYTHIFSVFKLEMLVCVLIGIVIGHLYD